MENQHQKITGYRDLSQMEIDLMNAIKTKGAELATLIATVEMHIHQQKQLASDDDERARLNDAQPSRWVAISKTEFQTGLMALTRAVAQPTTF